MGGIGQRIAAGLLAAGIPVQGLALASTGRGFVTHGTIPQLRRLCGLDGESLYHRAREVCGHGKSEEASGCAAGGAGAG